MRQRPETSLEDPSTNDPRPLLQRAFGHTEPEQQEDQYQARDTVDDRAVDPAQPEDQTQPEDQWDADREAVADDVPPSERQMDGQDDVHRDDDTDAPRGDYEPAAFDEPTEFKPGDAPAEAVTPIWSDDSARDFRDRWREAQLSFVDDPQKAADDIRTLVDESVEALTAALASQREQLNSWPDNRDTEQYRMVVQRYRTFFERLLAL